MCLYLIFIVVEELDVILVHNLLNIIKKKRKDLQLYYFIDTSKSNLEDNFPKDQIYLVDGLDGSGKKRDSNYDTLSECSKDILLKFKPENINVIIHSASGGSGSVIGPIIVSEMLARKESVIVLLVGGTASRIEAKNTLNTLKSYEMISQKRDMPVVTCYKENTLSRPRGHVDSEMTTTIVLLSSIFSEDNKEIDKSDLRNFLTFNVVTSHTSQLALLNFFSQNIELDKGEHLLSLLTLTDTTVSSDIVIPVEYQTVGYISESTKNSIDIAIPIHAGIISGYFNNIVTLLENKLKVFDEHRNTLVEKRIVDENTKSTNDGLVF
jgi:hypothetical protein